MFVCVLHRITKPLLHCKPVRYHCTHIHTYTQACTGFRIFIFSCDSSSISHNVGRSVCPSVGLSVCLSVCRSVGPQRVLQQCYALNSVFMLFLVLYFRTLKHFVDIFCIFSCDSSSISRNVGRSVGRSVGQSVCQQRVLQKCYAVGSVYMLLVLLQLRLLDHSLVIFSILAAIAALQAEMSVGLSVCLQRVLWKCYDVISA